jgi:hypothetical protein
MIIFTFVKLIKHKMTPRSNSSQHLVCFPCQVQDRCNATNNERWYLGLTDEDGDHSRTMRTFVIYINIFHYTMKLMICTKYLLPVTLWNSWNARTAYIRYIVKFVKRKNHLYPLPCEIRETQEPHLSVTLWNSWNARTAFIRYIGESVKCKNHLYPLPCEIREMQEPPLSVTLWNPWFSRTAFIYYAAKFVMCKNHPLSTAWRDLGLDAQLGWSKQK